MVIAGDLQLSCLGYFLSVVNRRMAVIVVSLELSGCVIAGNFYGLSLFVFRTLVLV